MVLICIAAVGTVIIVALMVALTQSNRKNSRLEIENQRLRTTGPTVDRKELERLSKENKTLADRLNTKEMQNHVLENVEQLLKAEKYADVLIRLAQYEASAVKPVVDLAKRALLGLIRKEKSNERQSAIIFEWVPKGSRGELEGFAAALKIHWSEKQPTIAYNELSGLIQKGCPVELFAFLSNPYKLPAGTNPTGRKTIKMIEELSHAIHEDMTRPDGKGRARIMDLLNEYGDLF
jgi:hypothetical protein